MRGEPGWKRGNPFGAAIVGGVVAMLLVVALPGLGISDTFSSQGGPPDVYTQTLPLDTCVHVDHTGTQVVMDQQGIGFSEQSNLVVYFSAKLGELSPRESVAFSLGLDGDDTDDEWSFAGPGSSTSKSFGAQQVATLMWTFDHVDVGDGPHSVQVFARVTGGDLPAADVNGCALTVLVSPTIE